MAIRYYDQALVDKIQHWVIDPNMRVLSPQDSTRFFLMKAELNNDKPLTLPMVAISRDSDIEIITTTKRPLSYEGKLLLYNAQKSKLLNAIPIKLSYLLDIYTRYFAEADEYFRNFIFNFINYPMLKIEIPYNDSHIEHNSTVLVESTVSDNSDIPERLVAGQFTRMTIHLTIDDAYLFSVPFMDNWKVEVTDVIIKENEEKL